MPDLARLTGIPVARRVTREGGTGLPGW